MALTGKDIEKINIYEYEEILMGHKLNFKVSFRSSPKNNRIELANVWRYAITVLLGWTPKDAEKYLTADIVHKYCLDKTFVAVDKNYEKKFHADYKSILQYVFPDEITYNQDEETINEYSRSAKINQYANEKKNYRLPKNFFSDENGNKRCELLLKYVIDLYFSTKSIEELYDFFNKKKEAMDWLKDKKLDLPLKIMEYEPIDFYHYFINEERKDDLIYYTKKLEKICSKKRKKKGC